MVEYMFCKYTVIGSSPIISKNFKIMQKKIKKNINQRLLFKNLEKKRLIIKIISNNFNLKKIIRWKIEQKWFNFNKTTNDLSFLSAKEIERFAQENGFGFELMEHSSRTSNVVMILKRL